jgi:FkbM family methyltransferase
MSIKDFFNKIVDFLVTKYLLPKSKIFYAQSGEDLILSHLFVKLGIDKPNYLDIGANDPKFISNTYKLYRKGCNGVLVEPNPIICNNLKETRPRDIILNFGVGVNNINKAKFFLFPKETNGLSTFSEKDALYWQEVGMKDYGKIYFEDILEVDLIPINEILEQYFFKLNKSIDFISLDVEGLDLEILKSIDFNKFKPKIICVETLQYSLNQVEQKNVDIITFLLEKNYLVYADTHVNTIFLLNE